MQIIPSRRFINSAVVVLVLAASSCGSPEETPVTGSYTIVLDDEHNFMAQKSSDGSRYRIPACAELVIQPNDYEFTIPSNIAEDQPNSVQLISGKRVYRAEWKQGSKILLNPQTLERIQGEVAFTGFKVNESFVIAIGRDNFPPADQLEIVFKPMWFGKLSISEDQE